MLRDPSLVPLSHQHQHALALCVRIDRGLRDGQADPAALQQDAASLFQDEIEYHFRAEEQVLFPRLWELEPLRALIDELRVEHVSLRRYGARAAAGQLTTAELQVFAGSLSAHIRKEERQLFEQAQAALPHAELERLGRELDAFFGASGMPGASCRI
jgi:hemerythrin-like domain-containing protein